MPYSLIVPVGARCSGKNYWTDKAIEAFLGLRILKSNTTRPKRSPPDDKIDECAYYFWTERQFDDEIAAERLIQTGEHSGFRYGLHLGNIEKELHYSSGVIPLIPSAAEMVYDYFHAKFPVRIIVLQPTIHLLAKNRERRGEKTDLVKIIAEDNNLRDREWRVPVACFDLNDTPADAKILELFDPNTDLGGDYESTAG